MLEAEYSVIGSMLIDDACIGPMVEVLTEDDFTSDRCKDAFRVIAKRWATGESVDLVVVGAEIGGEDVGQFLIGCMDTTPTAANADEYAAILKADTKKRKMAEVADRLAYGEDPALCIADLNEIAKEGTHGTIKGDAWHDQFVEMFNKNREDPDSAFCRTGFQQLDETLGGGMVKGGLYILGARPGMGKTTVAINIAEKIAERGSKVLFVSLEMSPHQIMCKRASMVARVPYKKILTGRVNSIEYDAVIQKIGEISQRPFITNTDFSLTVADIANLARKERGLSCVIVDYFGLITSNDNGKGGSRYEIYSDISRQLKQLAGTLNLPILCLAQLNREVEKGRRDKRPQLSDLRDTGSLEQDADSVIFLHRDGYYNENIDIKDEVLEIIVKKNRHGDNGTVKMYWFGHYGQICPIEEKREEAPPF